MLDKVAYLLEGKAAASAARSLLDMKALAARAEVHLGSSEFPACVSLLDGDARRSALDGKGTIELGWMVYDLKSGGRSTPRFFRAVMHADVMAIPPQKLADLAR